MNRASDPPSPTPLAATLRDTQGAVRGFANSRQRDLPGYRAYVSRRIVAHLSYRAEGVAQDSTIGDHDAGWI
ncbi:hypothetical protein [Novosphingobium sp. 9U]|uniref:hypothetical protein n=1 Tax=Novosphingobium sp. 9U TaxID=2653158 RepID=UPI0012F43E0B|nr:hypothetical protein [Novosphingobium sp. 9U]VWX51695.1 hypothetical protein NOVOSPHI9U_40323 [Novosphingobium sp. 9U]